jgi:hypothetical protein
MVATWSATRRNRWPSAHTRKPFRWRPVQQGVELRTECLTDWGGDGRQFPGEPVDRMAETVAEARTREPCLDAFDRTVEAIGQDAPDPIRQLLLERRTLELLIRLGQGRRTGVFGVAQMPEHTATDNRGQIHLLGETVAVLFIRQDIDGEGQTTPGQNRDDTLVAEGADQAIEGHRRDLTDDRTAFQTEPTMRRQRGVASDIRSHLARAQDEMRQDGEHRFARRALYPPDGDPTQTDAHIMRVAGQTPASATGRLVGELNADGQDEGQHTFEKRFPVAKQLNVGRFILKIDGDGTIYACLCGCFPHVSPSGHQVSSADEIRWR